MEQKHLSKGDNIAGNKSVTNNLNLNIKVWVCLLLLIVLAITVYFSSKNEITGIRGSYNNGNKIEISK